MARMHSRRKGKSGSTKPLSKEVPNWVKLKPKEIESLIIKLRKKDYSISRIGLELRDTYGVPDVKLITGKKISQVLNENDLRPKFPDDLMNLMKRAVNLRKHLKSNNHDIHNKRSLQLIESKIHRLSKYYRRQDLLPKGWTYSYDRAKLLVE